MSNELLTRAAKLLRSRVADLPVRLQQEWHQDSSEIYAGANFNTGDNWVGETTQDGGAEIAYYVVTMHPLVALYLAAWLEDAAKLVTPSHAAHNVALAVLRELP